MEGRKGERKEKSKERNKAVVKTRNNILVQIWERSTSYEMPLWMKHKLESRLLEEISITSDM